MFEVHFLNVGHGDCIVIRHASGRISVIDINNGQSLDQLSFQELAGQYQLPYSKIASGSFHESLRRGILCESGYNIKLTNPVDFLVKRYSQQGIFRYIQTHPHMDHMRGLYDLYRSGIIITNFWDVRHNFQPDLQTDSDRDNWNEYEQHRCGYRNTTLLYLTQGAAGQFFNAHSDGDGIEVLWPTAEYVNELYKQGDINPNNLSYVLRVTYQGVKFIFGGDAEQYVWQELVETYGKNLKCDVLKASHHGRDTGYCEEAVRLMKPQYTIVSVGKKPNTDAYNEYSRYSENVWSTRWKGTISFFHNGNGCTVEPEYDRK